MSKTYTDRWIDKNGVTRYFQDADATLKLAGIEDGADENVIESVSVNNQPVTPDINKNVNITIPAAPVQSISKNNISIAPDINGNINITVPTGAAADKEVDTSIAAASESTNLPTSAAVANFVEGKGYLTQNAVTSVNGQTGAVNITAVSFEVLAAEDSLPAVGVAGRFYFKPNGSSTGTNLYDEWVDTSANGTWECLGPVEVDLSNYVQKTDVMTGAGASVAGAAGLVPAPAAGDNNKVLFGNGTWNTVATGSPTVTTVTLAASNWNNNQYSLASLYPDANYNIEISPHSGMTEAELNAWNVAQPIGSATNNLIVARGIVPTIDITVMVTVFEK